MNTETHTPTAQELSDKIHRPCLDREQALKARIAELETALERNIATAIRPTKLFNETEAEFQQAVSAYEQAVALGLIALDKRQP